MLFNPTKDEILAGQKLFSPGRNHKIEFLKSAVYTEQLPQYDMPEVINLAPDETLFFLPKSTDTFYRTCL